MLPKKDGFQLGQEIKTLRENMPMIFLTAKSLDPDKVKGFKIGADDYITKPFNMELLGLRIQALLKRHFSAQANTLDKKDLFTIGNYSFDYKNQELTIENSNKHLTKKEADAYYNSRAYGSRIGAWASKQSSILKKRQDLYKSIEEFKKKFPNKNKIPRPEYWSGWRIKPKEIEFWLDGQNRIHERLKYIRKNKKWKKVLLSP